MLYRKGNLLGRTQLILCYINKKRGGNFTMKIIKNLVDIDLKHSNQKHLLINGNNGLADYISPEDYAFLKNGVRMKTSNWLKQRILCYIDK